MPTGFSAFRSLSRLAVAAAMSCLTSAALAQPAPPLIKENATVKVSSHVWAIPDGNVGLVPNVGIIVGTRATMVVDTGLGPRNGQTVLREVAITSLDVLDPTQRVGRNALP